MQRIPLSRFMGGTIFLWSMVVFLHYTATSYGGLITLRFFLGMVEAPVVPAIEITLGMFFVPATQGLLQPLFWISCQGAPIPAGFLAYGLLYTRSTVLPWKFFMIITGGLTFVSTHPFAQTLSTPPRPSKSNPLTIPKSSLSPCSSSSSTQTTQRTHAS
jgi:MFS family permease